MGVRAGDDGGGIFLYEAGWAAGWVGLGWETGVVKGKKSGWKFSNGNEISNSSTFAAKFRAGVRQEQILGR